MRRKRAILAQCQQSLSDAKNLAQALSYIGPMCRVVYTVLYSTS